MRLVLVQVVEIRWSAPSEPGMTPALTRNLTPTNTNYPRLNGAILRPRTTCTISKKKPNPNWPVGNCRTGLHHILEEAFFHIRQTARPYMKANKVRLSRLTFLRDVPPKRVSHFWATRVHLVMLRLLTGFEQVTNFTVLHMSHWLRLS